MHRAPSCHPMTLKTRLMTRRLNAQSLHHWGMMAMTRMTTMMTVGRYLLSAVRRIRRCHTVRFLNIHMSMMYILLSRRCMRSQTQPRSGMNIWMRLILWMIGGVLERKLFGWMCWRGQRQIQKRECLSWRNGLRLTVRRKCPSWILMTVTEMTTMALNRQ